MKSIGLRTSVGVNDPVHAGCSRASLRLRDRRVQILLIVLAVCGVAFAWMRDNLASGIPDSQSIPFLTYPGFAVTYSPGELSVWHDASFLLLLMTSVGMTVLAGLLVSYWASGKADAAWGIGALCALVVIADVQVTYWPQGREGAIRSLVYTQGRTVCWDARRVLTSTLLVVMGALVGLGLRHYRRTHSQSYSDVSVKNKRSRSPFASLFMILVVFAVCNTGFIFLRDLHHSGSDYPRLTEYPLRLLGGGGNLYAGAASIAVLLMVGFLSGRQSGLKRMGDKVALAVTIVSLAVLDGVLSMEYRFDGLGNTIGGLFLAIGVLGLGGVLGSLVSQRRQGTTSATAQ